MTYGHAVHKELREPSRALRRAIPEVYDGYRQMHAAAYAAGALDEKTKELIALAIAVSKECDGCIASHARGAARTGATESEVAEALGVAIAMNGGTGHRVRPPRAPGFRGFAGEAGAALAPCRPRRPRFRRGQDGQRMRTPRPRPGQPVGWSPGGRRRHDRVPASAARTPSCSRPLPPNVWRRHSVPYRPRPPQPA